jgi:hypothetical protein
MKEIVAIHDLISCKIYYRLCLMTYCDQPCPLDGLVTVPLSRMLLSLLRIDFRDLKYEEDLKMHSSIHSHIRSVAFREINTYAKSVLSCTALAT